MHTHTERLVERIEKMIAAGRLTAEEAERVRAAAGTGELDDVVREIRLRHVRERLDAALADGGLTPEEANAIVERVEHGEVPRFRRGRQRTHEDRSSRGREADSNGGQPA